MKDSKFFFFKLISMKMRMIDERILYRIVEFYLIRTVFTFYVKEERYHLRNSN